MSDEYVEYSEEGWFSRIADSIKGIVVGVVLFLGAFPCIFLNECNSVETANSIAGAQSEVVVVSADKVDATNEGKLVMVSGEVKTTSELTDDIGVKTVGLQLRRKVEMYQWVEKKKEEKKKKVGGGEEKKTTYTYDKKWSNTLHDSSNFKKQKEKYRNPGSFPYEATEVTADAATLGAFSLNSRMIAKAGTAEKFALSEVPSGIGADKVKIDQGGIYIGKDPGSPKVGDTRIEYEVVKPGVATLIAAQKGNSFDEYTSKKVTKPMERVMLGKKTKEEAFEQMQAENEMVTWILRLVLFLMIFGGLSLIFRPLSVIADVIPFIGSAIGAASTLMAFMIAVPLWLLAVALAWVAARPLIGILLLIGAGVFIGGVVALVMRFSKKD